MNDFNGTACAPATSLETLDLEKIAKAYDSPPWWYDLRGFFILTFAYQSTLWQQVGFFSRQMRGRHLEVAIGTGTLFKMVMRWRRLLGRPAGRVDAMDYSDTMLSGARRSFASWKNVRIYQGDVTRLDAADGAFASVSIANAFHCFAEPEAALREVHRVLESGGTLAMNVLLFPRGWWPLRRIAEKIDAWGIRKGILVTPYRIEDLRRMLSAAGLEVREERVGGNCLSLVAVRPG